MGLSRTTILFIVASGLSLILGVLRIPNVSHGSLYMIGAFMAFTVTNFRRRTRHGFWLALIVAPLGVAFLSLVAERGLFQFLYEREHLMLLLLTFAFSLVFGDLVKLVWGGGVQVRARAPMLSRASSPSSEAFPFPATTSSSSSSGPSSPSLLWLLDNKTKIGKISRAAAVDREMVGAVGINVSWVFASVFVIGCFLAGLGGSSWPPR